MQQTCCTFIGFWPYWHRIGRSLGFVKVGLLSTLARHAMRNSKMLLKNLRFAPYHTNQANMSSLYLVHVLIFALWLLIKDFISNLGLFKLLVVLGYSILVLICSVYLHLKIFWSRRPHLLCYVIDMFLCTCMFILHLFFIDVCEVEVTFRNLCCMGYF